jgi:hypothetical protein
MGSQSLLVSFHLWLDGLISCASCLRWRKDLLLEGLHRQCFLAILFFEKPCVVERDLNMNAFEEAVSQGIQVSLL